MSTDKENKTIPFENMRYVLLSPWFIGFYLILIMVSFYQFDQPVALYFQSLNLNETAYWLRWVTNLGLGGTYLISFFLLALFFRYVYKNHAWENKAWFLWLCVLVPGIVCLLLKFLLGRARPALFFNHDLYGFFGFETSAAYWSFPSGHTSTIMGLAFGLGIIFPKTAYGFAVAGLIVALSRVLLLNHFLSDVLFAAYLSFIEISILYYWLQTKNFWNRDMLCVFCLKRGTGANSPG